MHPFKQIIYIAQPAKTKTIMDNEASTERRDPRPKGNTLMRSTMDIAMGVLYIGIGAILLYPEMVRLEMEGFDKTVRQLFGGLCMVYGIWRIYRGIRKDY